MVYTMDTIRELITKRINTAKDSKQRVTNTCALAFVDACNANDMTIENWDFTIGSLCECALKYALKMQVVKNNDIDFVNVCDYMQQKEINEFEFKTCMGAGCYANGNKHSTCKNVVIVNQNGIYLFNEKHLIYKDEKHIKGDNYVLNNYEIDNKKVIEYAIENDFIKELRAITHWNGLRA